MADYVERFTDKKAAELADEIKKVYRQAAREVQQGFNSFIQGFKARSAEMLHKVETGKLSKENYQKWLRGQVFQGKRWRERLDRITKVYTSADAKANAIVGDTVLDVFAEAANYTAWQITKDFRGAVSFNLYDNKTVERLLKDHPKILPEWNIDGKKDYVWNEKRVQNAITQGIIQGKSVQDVGKRLYTELAASNASKMNMFARTAMTGAQNAGRVERMREADEKYNIKCQKRWLSVGDAKVRDDHQDLNGKTVAYDEDFVVGGRTIAYPGDPTADADLVYNCRCTLLYINQYMKHGNYTLESHHLKEYDTYNKWKAEVSGGG